MHRLVVRKPTPTAFCRQAAPHLEAAHTLVVWLLGDERAAEAALQCGLRAACEQRRCQPAVDLRLVLLRAVARHCAGEVAVEADCPGEAGVFRWAAIPCEARLALALVDGLGLSYAQAAVVMDCPTEELAACLAEGRMALCAAG